MRSLACQISQAAFVTAGLLLAAAPARAATSTKNFTVQITITAGCSIAGAPNLDFSSQATLAASVDQMSSMGVKCSTATPYSIRVDAGTGSGATAANRDMTSAADTAGYALSRDAARSAVRGDKVGTATVLGKGYGSAQGFTGDGRVPPQAATPVVTSSDTITVTVTY